MNGPHLAVLPGVDDLRPARPGRYQPTPAGLQRDADELEQILASVGENVLREGPRKPAPSLGTNHVPGEREANPPAPSPGTPACPTCLGTGIAVDTLPCIHCNNGIWPGSI